jgi:hypothetical protein
VLREPWLRWILVVQVDDLADGPGRLALMVWGEAQRDRSVARLAATEVSRIRDRRVRLLAAPGRG